MSELKFTCTIDKALGTIPMAYSPNVFYHRARLLLLSCCFFIFSSSSYGQSELESFIPSLMKRSSQGSSGNSVDIAYGETTLNISQSIGQSSPIGTHQQAGYTLIQGYQQPSIIKSYISSDDKLLLARIYPNPFQDVINIAFDEHIQSTVEIALYDLTGRILKTQKFPPAQLVVLEWSEVPMGVYMLNIVVGDKRIVAKPIKE